MTIDLARGKELANNLRSRYSSFAAQWIEQAIARIATDAAEILRLRAEIEALRKQVALSPGAFYDPEHLV